MNFKRYEFETNNDVIIFDPIQASNDIIDDLKRILETKKIKFICRSEIKDEKAVYDKIEKSRISIFILKNISSEDFIDYYEFCKEMRIFAIFITLEEMSPNLININQLNVFDSNVFKQKMMFQQFMTLVHKMLRRDDKLVLNSSTECFKKAIVDKIEDPIAFIEITENKHFIIINGINIPETMLYIFDQRTFNFVKKIKLQENYQHFPIHLNTYCYIKNLDQFFFINFDHLYLMSRDYEKRILIKQFQEIGFGEFTVICHDETSVITFIFNSQQNKIITFKGKDVEENKVIKMKNIPQNIEVMKLIKSFLYFLSSEDIRVFDLNLNYVAKFGNMKLINALNMHQINNTDYLYVVDINELKVFNTNNFKYIGSVNLNGEIGNNENLPRYLICNNSIADQFRHLMYICSDFIPIFKINLSISNRNIDKNDLNKKFICTINPFNKHLLFDPYRLSCGNISCIECIYDYYNLLTNEFKCPFENCEFKSHSLKTELFKLNIIEDNAAEICANQIDFFNKRLSKLTIDYRKFLLKIFYLI